MIVVNSQPVYVSRDYSSGNKVLPSNFPQFRELFFNVYGGVLDFVVILQAEKAVAVLRTNKSV